VARHVEFAERRTTKLIDGSAVTGWFTEDFTLEELKTLRARERLPELRPQNVAYDGQFEIPTLQEIIDLVRANEPLARRRIGIYPETKHPSYFAQNGLALEERLIEGLHRNGYASADAPIFIQSFEVENLRRLSSMTPLPLIQLVAPAGKPYDFATSGDPRTYFDLVSPQGLVSIARYAVGIGPHIDMVLRFGAEGDAPSSLTRDAHALGLLVHAWTLRAENYFLPQRLRRGDPQDPTYLRAYGDIGRAAAAFLDAGIDGFFTDNADLCASARHQWLAADRA
jgi:glycerophosphoryl diester phosphodiesterase